MLLTELDVRTLAYIHTGIANKKWTYDYLGGTVRAFLRKNYRGTLVSSGAYTPETAAAAIEARDAELISIGRPFIANPDYVARVKEGVELINYEASMLETLR
jgi:2,4-dienoyl-CoA reductase-like NADH-dependent reductase (Old Yellow Enzyme family)